MPVVGDRGLIDATLSPWAASVNPGTESFGLWLLRQRVAARGQVTSYEPYASAGWTAWVQATRNWLRDRALPSPANGVYEALVLGDRMALDSGVKGRVERTQTQHLLALSGLHIGTLGLWVYGLAGLMWRVRPFSVRQDL
ncbi:MAG: ComEC/Rec2 family competence protein, partial [Natronospirillum sp.]